VSKQAASLEERGAIPYVTIRFGVVRWLELFIGGFHGDLSLQRKGFDSPWSQFIKIKIKGAFYERRKKVPYKKWNDLIIYI
jgi:hypothetical protein